MGYRCRSCYRKGCRERIISPGWVHSLGLQQRRFIKSLVYCKNKTNRKYEILKLWCKSVTKFIWQKIFIRFLKNVTAERPRSFIETKGIMIWFTGLSGSGKSTLAIALERNYINKVYSAVSWMETISAVASIITWVFGSRPNGKYSSHSRSFQIIRRLRYRDHRCFYQSYPCYPPDGLQSIGEDDFLEVYVSYAHRRM